MYSVFDKREEFIVFYLRPDEVLNTRALFQAIINDEEAKGKQVPIREDFFRNFLPTGKIVQITLGFMYFHIATRYIDVVLNGITDIGGDTEYVEQFLAKVKFYVLKKSPHLQIIQLNGCEF